MTTTEAREARAHAIACYSIIRLCGADAEAAAAIIVDLLPSRRECRIALAWVEAWVLPHYDDLVNRTPRSIIIDRRRWPVELNGSLGDHIRLVGRLVQHNRTAAIRAAYELTD